MHDMKQKHPVRHEMSTQKTNRQDTQADRIYRQTGHGGRQDIVQETGHKGRWEGHQGGKTHRHTVQ
jgi:hypothetical protein